MAIALPSDPLGSLILVDDGPGETRWALCDAQGALREVVLSRAHRPEAGACLAGRVRERVPGHAAVFVDLGAPPWGFLAAEDAAGGLPPLGTRVLVQVLRPAVETKGPKLTLALSWPGRFWVLTPGRPGLGMSTKIPGNRKALRAHFESFLAPGEGVIARSEIAEAGDDALQADLEALRTLAAEVARRFSATSNLGLLQEAPSPLAAWLEEPGGAQARIVVDSGGRFPFVQALVHARFPGGGPQVTVHHDPATALFEAYGVEAALEEALEPGVAVPGGGFVHFAETQAVSAVDIDAQGQAPDLVAQAAVPLIARHIRLRGLAGQIVIDFPRRRGPPDPALVTALAEALAQDPAGARVLGGDPGRPRRSGAAPSPAAPLSPAA
ncbi:ribonuclease E/G [Pararhodospirillum photometricum]|uniref:Ribonuclease G (RNase G) n=1 Tax=Pararhodospirillum photometricum DSM 122 TaxID=1150469 RepID=H6SP79_PARPM|nr:ribonuclease E/G [Pararhodospirillum photometricum]CCG07151.1 Ribonuclease G (RNase G) [Pararhodospirillum photometricum DSM 122]